MFNEYQNTFNASRKDNNMYIKLMNTGIYSKELGQRLQ